MTWDRKRLTFRFEELAHGAPWPLTEFSEVSFGDTLGQVKPRLEPVGFFGKTQRLADVLVQTFGRAGTNLGRDLV